MAQQVPFAKRVTVSGQPPNQSVGENMDKWGGYLASRRAVTEFLAKRKPSNPVVITGDVHTNWAFDIHEDGDRGSILASEFVGTSISSSGDGSDRQPITDRLYAENPHLKFFNGQRGYVKCTVDAKLWRTEYRVVPYISKPGAPISTRETFVLESGRAGMRRA
jgi:alkaline phosphatase D